MDRYLHEDLEMIRKSNLPIEELEGSTVFVTGATGLIGAQLVRALLAIDRGIRPLALVRSIEKAKAIFKNDFNRVSWIQSDITKSLKIDRSIDYIFHCAGVTTSKTMVQKPVETLMVAIQGTRNILELAREKNVQSVVYLSSMEMYGVFDDIGREVKEDDIGFINPLKVRSNYPESKRLCENMCVAYLSEYGVPVKIARLAQTFGAGVLKNENRIFAQFARSAIRCEDIVLHTRGLSEGNYCYVRDTIRALFVILLKGKSGEAYNVANPDAHTTIAKMAEMVCNEICDGKIHVVYDIPEENVFGYAADTKIKLNADKLKELGWEPEVGLKEAYIRLIGSMRQTGNY